MPTSLRTIGLCDDEIYNEDRVFRESLEGGKSEGRRSAKYNMEQWTH